MKNEHMTTIKPPSHAGWRQRAIDPNIAPASIPSAAQGSGITPRPNRSGSSAASDSPAEDAERGLRCAGRSTPQA